MPVRNKDAGAMKGAQISSPLSPKINLIVILVSHNFQSPHLGRGAPESNEEKKMNMPTYGLANNGSE
jgi:hypothetical protein